MPKTGMFKFARLSDIPESQFRSSLSSLERPDYLMEQETKSSILSPLSDKQPDQSAIPAPLPAPTKILQPKEATTSKTNLIPQRGRRPSLCSSISMLDLRKVQSITSNSNLSKVFDQTDLHFKSWPFPPLPWTFESILTESSGVIEKYELSESLVKKFSHASLPRERFASDLSADDGVEVWDFSRRVLPSVQTCSFT